MTFGPSKGRVDVSKAEIEEFLDGLHDDDCDGGKFQLVVEPGYYTKSALGPIELSHIPFFVCNSCGAKYMAPKFDEWVESSIAERLIFSDFYLTKKEWKFLRHYFGLSQEKVGELLGIDKHEVSKFESRKFPEKNYILSKQVQLKGKYATLMHPKKQITVEELEFVNTSEERHFTLDSVSYPEEKEISAVYSPAC